MRTKVIFACFTWAASALAACQAIGNGAPPAPSPIVPEPRVVAHGNWDGDLQGFVGVNPVTAFFQLKGHATVEFRAFGPTYLWIDGASDFTITPTVGKEMEAIVAVDTRAVVIIRDGINVGLRRLPPMPQPTPPPPPAPIVKPPEPVAALCVPGGPCDAPLFVH